MKIKAKLRKLFFGKEEIHAGLILIYIGLAFGSGTIFFPKHASILNLVSIVVLSVGGIYSYIRSDKKGKKRFLKILAFCLLGALVVFLILCYKFDLSIF